MTENYSKELSLCKGKIGFYYKNLMTGEQDFKNPDMPLMAASVIKLSVMAEFFRQAEEEGLDIFATRRVARDECLPSCGAVTYMNDNPSLTLIDLCTFMIIFSDNTATNILINLLGMDKINQNAVNLGLKNTKINRLLFDSELSKKGYENYTCAGDCALLLEQIYNGKLVSKKASEKMLWMLKSQRLNGKIPFFLHSYTKACVAHKTGEDSGITHDVGVVLDKVPFIICFLSNETDVPLFERKIQDLSYKIWQDTNAE